MADAVLGQKYLRMKDSSRKAGCDGGFEMNSESCECFGEALSSLDTCHHSSVGQILTTIYAPAFSLAGVCGRKVGERN